MSWTSGLPPVAHERIERQRASRVAGSLLSAGAAAAVLAAGFRPIGEVMGCVVMHIGWVGYRCAYGASGGVFGAGYGRSPVLVSGDLGPHGEHRTDGLGPQAAAYNQAWDGALNRMLLEANALGADGVVGVRLTERVLDGANHEFVALGTAVSDGNALTPGPDRWPFCTDLGGPDVAKLAGSGWLPTGIAIGLSMALRHDDYATLAAQRSWSNQEIVGYSELLSASRADARRQLSLRAHRVGGEHVVISSLRTTTFVREVSDGHTDHGAHTTIVGTALRRAAPDEPAAGAGAGDWATGRPPLTVMPLSARAPGRRAGRGDRPTGGHADEHAMRGRP
jgi:uncharacterized protein YbjQ (UPF0145 family)